MALGLPVEVGTQVGGVGEVQPGAVLGEGQAQQPRLPPGAHDSQLLTDVEDLNWRRDGFTVREGHVAEDARLLGDPQLVGAGAQDGSGRPVQLDHRRPAQVLRGEGGRTLAGRKPGLF